jgi:hypothetical protein
MSWTQRVVIGAATALLAVAVAWERGAFSEGPPAAASGLRPSPAWLEVPGFMAHTSDGYTVAIEVYIDVPDEPAHEALASDLYQLTLELQLVASSMSRERLMGRHGIEELSSRMLETLRARTGTAHNAKSVRGVAFGKMFVWNL